MRSPFLQMGGDTQFSMLYNNNFDYDCSWPTRFIFHSLRFNDPDKIVLGRAFGYMDAEIGLYPYTMDFESVQVEPFYHSFSNKQDSVHILWRVYCFKNQNVDSNNFSWLRIVRSHLVPPAAILDSGSSPCSIWKVSLAYLGIKHSFFLLFLRNIILPFCFVSFCLPFDCPG